MAIIQGETVAALDVMNELTGKLSLTGGTMTGDIIFSSGFIGINQASTSNYKEGMAWYKGGTSQNTYDPHIGHHNTGGTEGTGAMVLLPYATATNPWEGNVGLYITKNSAKLDGATLLTSSNYSDYITINSDLPVAVKDKTNSTATYLNYGASGLSTTSWFAAWNGYELRAISPNVSANLLINSLTTGTSAPTDNDYFISQYAGGGTTTTTYHRRPISTLWSYINGKIGSSYFPYNGWWTSGNGNSLDNASGMVFAYPNHGAPSAWGTTCTFEYLKGSSYRFQMHSTGYDNSLYYRNYSADRGAWTSWARILDSECYSSYALPLSGGKLTGSLTIENHSSKIGTTKSVSTDTSYSVGSSAKAVASISLEAGVWYLYSGMNFDTTADTAWVYSTLSATSGALDIYGSQRIYISSTAYDARIVSMGQFAPSTTTTYYLNAWTNDTSVKCTQQRIRAIRIA